MLFNSFQFLFFFLPITFAGFYIFKKSASLIWLLICSLFFYSWWNPAHLPILIFSIIFNFYLGNLITKSKSKKTWLIFGLTINLGFIGYYKYSQFFVNNFFHIFRLDPPQLGITLPLAISFFTFTQIAYLIDAYADRVKDYTFLEYALFVTTFPHLIAGPIVHHDRLIFQFRKPTFFQINPKNIAVGLTLFIVGLAKKTIIADSISKLPNITFHFVQQGNPITLIEAWLSALSFTMQIYFDFSGYSDMAVGLGLLFNLDLPINFLSPYQALNISEFWRRWHISLSDFLRTYLYNPLVLAGSRKGKPRPYVNMIITMTLAGLWHGAGWTFVIWGFLHGVYLVTHHQWQKITKKRKWEPFGSLTLGRAFSRTLTFFFVIISFVFFRSESARAAFRFLKYMFTGHLFGPNHVPVSWFGIKFKSFIRPGFGISNDLFLLSLTILVAAVMFAPNVLTWLNDYVKSLEFDNKLISHNKYHLRWSPTVFWGITIALLGCIATYEILDNVQQFIYFQF